MVPRKSAGCLPVYRGRRAERQHYRANDGELVEHVPRLVDVSCLVNEREKADRANKKHRQSNASGEIDMEARWVNRLIDWLVDRLID